MTFQIKKFIIGFISSREHVRTKRFTKIPILLVKSH